MVGGRSVRRKLSVCYPCTRKRIVVWTFLLIISLLWVLSLLSFSTQSTFTISQDEEAEEKTESSHHIITLPSNSFGNVKPSAKEFFKSRNLETKNGDNDHRPTTATEQAHATARVTAAPTTSSTTTEGLLTSRAGTALVTSPPLTDPPKSVNWLVNTTFLTSDLFAALRHVCTSLKELKTSASMVNMTFQQVQSLVADASEQRSTASSSPLLPFFKRFLQGGSDGVLPCQSGVTFFGHSCVDTDRRVFLPAEAQPNRDEDEGRSDVYLLPVASIAFFNELGNKVRLPMYSSMRSKRVTNNTNLDAKAEVFTVTRKSLRRYWPQVLHDRKKDSGSVDAMNSGGSSPQAQPFVIIHVIELFFGTNVAHSFYRILGLVKLLDELQQSVTTASSATTAAVERSEKQRQQPRQLFDIILVVQFPYLPQFHLQLITQFLSSWVRRVHVLVPVDAKTVQHFSALVAADATLHSLPITFGRAKGATILPPNETRRSNSTTDNNNTSSQPSITEKPPFVSSLCTRNAFLGHPQVELEPTSANGRANLRTALSTMKQRIAEVLEEQNATQRKGDERDVTPPPPPPPPLDSHNSHSDENATETLSMHLLIIQRKSSRRIMNIGFLKERLSMELQSMDPISPTDPN